MPPNYWECHQVYLRAVNPVVSRGIGPRDQDHSPGSGLRFTVSRLSTPLREVQLHAPREAIQLGGHSKSVRIEDTPFREHRLDFAPL